MRRTLQVLFLFLIISKSGFGQACPPRGSEFYLAMNTIVVEVKKGTAESSAVSAQALPAVEAAAEAAPQEADIDSDEDASYEESASESTETAGDKVPAVVLSRLPDDPAVSFYPNPVKDYINVQFPAKGNHTIQIFNIIGEKVTEKAVLDEDLISLNLGNYQSGVYFLKYEYAGKVYTKKFSKN